MKSSIKRKFRRIGVITGIILLVFVIYVEIANRNSKNMTYRQKVLKALYPASMWLSKITGKKNTTLKQEQKLPVLSFYDLEAGLNNGQTLKFSSFKGKKVMIVNTASDCGFTGQYAELESLYQEEKDRLQIIAFPANDFKQQEQGSDEQIAEFCKLNFGVSFPLMKKTTVIRGENQHPVYQWLTEQDKNGWNSREPEWNFTKYLIDENGVLTHYFGAAVSPLNAEVRSAVNHKTGKDDL